MSNNTKLRIGLFGAGVVGGGVYELIQRCIDNKRFAALGVDIEIAKICVKSLSKDRDFKISSNTVITTDYDDILNDSDINCIVELMGGITDAK